jgi:hypothetical protein
LRVSSVWSSIDCFHARDYRNQPSSTPGFFVGSFLCFDGLHCIQSFCFILDVLRFDSTSRNSRTRVDIIPDGNASVGRSVDGNDGQGFPTDERGPAKE